MYVDNQYQPSFTFHNCPNVAVPILAFTDDSHIICYTKLKPISIVNSSRWESIRACMGGLRRGTHSC
jgi:hypothetical protein